MIYRNRFEVMGNIGNTPEVVNLEKGIAVNIAVATNKPFTTDEGTKYQTDWHEIQIYGRHANYAAKALKKGMAVAIEGKLRTRKVTLEGGARIQISEMVVNERHHTIIPLVQPQTRYEPTDVIDSQPTDVKQPISEGPFSYKDIKEGNVECKSEEYQKQHGLPQTSKYARPPMENWQTAQQI